MSIYERRGLDRGMTHHYVEDRENTQERLSEEAGRIIVEKIGDDDNIYPKLVSARFPLFYVETLENKRIHHLPVDSKDLTDMIRLSRDMNQVKTLGLILGIRLKQIKTITNELPVDTVLSRFAVHSKSNNSINNSGIDIKPLPPFDHYSSQVSYNFISELILNDLCEIGNQVEPKLDDFLDGVSDGFESV